MKVLMILAHADDEIIFGYPYFQRDDVELTLLMCSTDHDHPTLYPRMNVLEKICSERNIKLHTFKSQSNFYKLKTADGSLKKFYQRIISQFKSLQNNCDIIFTHNPHGEYGHQDHRIIFDIVSSYATKPVIYTDIHVDAGWALLPINPLYYAEKIDEIKLNEEIYEKFKKYYQQEGVWTWRETTVPSCRLFKLPLIHPKILGRCW